MGLNHVVNESLLENNYLYRRLHEEHEDVEQELKDLKQAPSVDGDQVKLLKKVKLRIADRMNSIESAILR